MKKLIIAAVAMAGAIVASASTVTWGASASDTIDAEKIASGTFYLMYASDAEAIDLSKFSGQNKFDASTLAAAGFDKEIDQFTYGTKFQNKNNALTPNSTGLTAGTYAMYGILIGDALPDGTQYLAIYEEPKNVQIAATAGQNQGRASGGFSYYQTESVPEPTSGLLLLLGVAGLALRRRRA